MSALLAPVHTLELPPLRTIDISTFRQPNGKPTKLSDRIEIPPSFRIFGDDGGEPPASRPRMFRVMTPEKGDERLVWDSRILREIRDAKKFFMSMVAKGFKPFKCDSKGKALPEVMKRFDAHAEEIVFLPQAAVCGG